MIYGLRKFSSQNNDPKITRKHHSILSWVLIIWLRIAKQDKIILRAGKMFYSLKIQCLQNKHLINIEMNRQKWG